MKQLSTLFLLLFAAVVFSQSEGQLAGQAVDAKTGEPLPGVNILLVNTTIGQATDLSGRFELTGIPTGVYTLRASRVGYRSLQMRNIHIPAQPGARLTLALEPILIQEADVVVTAAKRRQSIQESPNSVGVLTSRDLVQKNEIYLDKMLENASGVNFMGSQINIRGSSGYNYGAGTRVLMLIDGVPVLPGDSGDLKWDLVPATQVERVEIIKGAGSALYGSSALGGVVNIITKSATDRPLTHLRFSAGLYDKPSYPEWRWTDRLLHFDDMDVDHSRRIGKSQILLAAGRHQSTGYSQNGSYQRMNGSLKWFRPVSNRANLTVAANWEGGRRGTGLMWRSQRHALEVSPEAVGDHTKYDKFSVNAFHQWAVHGNLALKTRLSYFRNFWKNIFHDNITASTAHKFGLELQGDYQLSAVHVLTFGTEETWDQVQSGLVGNHDQYGLSAYVQDERRLFRTLSLTLGGRYDHQHIDTGFNDEKFSPKAGLVWQAHPSIIARFSSGKGFRAASMSERFSDSIYSGLRLVPNPNLRSETAWSHEIGANVRLGTFINLDIAGFSSDYWNLIEPVPDKAQNIQFINVTRARISGLETMVKINPWIRGLTCDIGYTLMDPRDLSLDEILAYRARRLLQTSLVYQFGPVELSADYRYISRLDQVKLYPMDDRVAQKTVNLHSGFRWHVWHLGGHVYNLFNHHHTQMERTLMPIRHFVLTLRTVL
ncbi:TonB-dependent receptor [bacterium]|nr:TonB-dependent receptor [bacterium]